MTGCNSYLYSTYITMTCYNSTYTVLTEYVHNNIIRNERHDSYNGYNAAPVFYGRFLIIVRLPHLLSRILPFLGWIRVENADEYLSTIALYMA